MKTLTRRYGTFGWQEFLQQKIDMLREYDSAKAKTSNRPVKVAHGNAAEASFRNWLKEFLPKKFGVTSGYIIPDLRKASYTLRHFDAIVYDAINSPVLWVETTLDKSGQGKSRAIPAEYVRSVLEIKATLTPRSILDAKEKLLEVNEFSSHLDPTYTSSIVFFEMFCLRRKWKNGNRVIVHKTGGRNNEQKAQILLAGRKGSNLETTPGKRRVHLGSVRSVPTPADGILPLAAAVV